MQMAHEYSQDAPQEAQAAYMSMPHLIRLRIREAAALRSQLGLPSKETDVYR
jgi:hypothetical protein